MWQRIRDWFLPTNQLKLVHKLWTVRIAVIGAILTAVYTSIPAFQDYVSPIRFLELNIGLALAVVVARITNQSGVDF